MTFLISRYLLLAAVLVGAGAFALSTTLRLDAELTVLAVTVTTFLIALLLERYLPFSNEWNRSHGDLRTDLVSGVALVGVVDPLLKYFVPLLLVAVYSLANPQSFSLLDGAPLWLQVVVAVLVIEFGRYWSHRLHHTVRPLWWLHAMHHSSERLYAVNNLRFHPLNYAINFLAGAVPAVVLGVGPEAMLGYLAITQPILMLQHANIDLKSGWLNYLLSTNELHRWHHSADPTEANSNYGNAIVLWDQLFGTFRYVKSGNAPDRVGLFGASADYPSRSGYFSQLKSMFTPACCGA